MMYAECFIATPIPGTTTLTYAIPAKLEEAVDLIGKTAELEFKIEDPAAPPSSPENPVPPSYISGNPPLKGSHLKRASQGFGQVGDAIVQLEFNEEGAKIFADMTKNNVGKSIGIFLDGEPISAPTVQGEIPDGVAQISGQFTPKSAKNLAIQLNAGALPVPIHLSENRTIGASLGTDSVKKSLFGGIIGIVAVMVFMVIYYRLPGLVASVALLIYILISLALFKGMLSFILPFTPVTLTLAGIAGFILSAGMAVDANVLIFERLKEELREGRSFDQAVQAGFKRAWNSIRDSNVSSLITTFILFSFGTGIIRGFAVTLALGILTSLFTAMVITKTLLRLVTRFKWGRAPVLYGFKVAKVEPESTS